MMVMARVKVVADPLDQDLRQSHDRHLPEMPE
jgi:hypothetical protein